MNRPNWVDYFLGLAFVVSQRSRDSQTKHGCVLTDRNNHILSTGYNSFARGRDDKNLDNTRPGKYPHIIHSEENSLLSCPISLWQVQGGAIGYITGSPCYRCLQRLWNANVTTLYIADRRGWQLDEQEKDDIDQFLMETKMEVYRVTPNLDFLLSAAQP